VVDHRPTRTLAEVLDAVRRDGDRPVDVEGVGEVVNDGTAPAAVGAGDRHGPVLDQLRAGLDHAARVASSAGGWTGDDPLRLSKGVITWLLRCPRRALASGDTGASDDLVAGLLVDAAAKLATLVPQRAPTVEAALAYLTASGDTTAADHLADRGDGAASLLDDVAERIARLASAWPTIDPAWWPRVEEPVRVRLAGGAVMVSGRLDLLLGGPPTDRPGVVVEVKGGRWYDGMRADGHLYALLVGLRDGVAPGAAVTVVSDGTTQVEPIRPAVLVTAADRVEQAIEVAVTLAAGEPPAAHPGTHCPHCPVRPDCPAGRDWRPDDALAEVGG
jgi:hypothetical protein